MAKIMSFFESNNTHLLHMEVLYLLYSCLESGGGFSMEMIMMVIWMSNPAAKHAQKPFW